MDSILVPSTIGRIPKKIASSFGGFTAEQWMNWTLVYSLYALRGLIPEQDYMCWEAFVLACRLLCSPVLTDAVIRRADLLLLHFCRKVELLYGKNEITPNMHRHCHLSDCIKDYGPIFGFWLFSFERYNGMLGKFPNNQKHIEVQLMQRFETEMELYALPLPGSLQDLFFPLFKAITGDLHEFVKPQANFHFFYLANSSFDKADVMLLFKCKWQASCRWTVHLLDDSELVSISQFLRNIFSAAGFIPEIGSLPKTVKCFKRIEFGEEVFSTYNDSRYGRHSYILANWAGNDGDIDRNGGMRPGRIQGIYLYKFKAGDGNIYTLPLLKVAWYKEHPRKNMFGIGLDLYCKNSFELCGPSSFMPIACVNSKFAPAYGSVNIASSGTEYESVLFVCPMRSKTFF